MYATEDGDCYVDLVNGFLANQLKTNNFTATTILVAQWIDVCPIDNAQCSEVIIYLITTFYKCSF